MFAHFVIAGLALVWLVALLYTLHLPRVHPWLLRHNALRLLTRWELFSGHSVDPKNAFVADELDFTDDPDSPAARWTTVVPSGAWAWHVALFNPGIATVTRVEFLCNRLIGFAAATDADPKALDQRRHAICSILVAHTARIWPPPAGVRRFRVVRRNGHAADDVVGWRFESTTPATAPTAAPRHG
ncbi:MAG: hypothetical protein RLZZ15_3841 [Verrucomicrobiota bacterium]